MKVALAFVLLLFAAGSVAAQPVYIDQLMEMPQDQLLQTFPGLKREGCYRIAENRFVLIAMDKKDRKPWRVAIAAGDVCRRSEDAVIDVRHRKGIDLGDTTIAIMEKMGRPDASAAPEDKQKKLGEIEYFYICRLEESCARHTSVFIRDGIVTAISEWYSE
ncbi:MAG TPA: hypothetical protein VEK57_09625 [Thermoanaerobaculia bacterium]|nr:hypothetical protein [Thermoanaerobaculia bacterium]